jgi:hypothetical protein
MTQLDRCLRKLEQAAETDSAERPIDLPFDERQQRIDGLWRRLEERNRWLKTATLEDDRRNREEWWDRFRREKPALAARLDAIGKRLTQSEQETSNGQPGPARATP